MSERRYSAEKVTMWWLAAGFLLALLLYGLRKKDVCSEHLAAAGRALETRNWAEFDRRMTQARTLAQRITDGRSRQEMVADIEYLAAHGAYARNRKDDAVVHLTLALQGFEELGEAARGVKLAACHQLWGEIAFDAGDCNEAEKHFRKAAVAVEFNDRPERVLSSLKSLGDVLLAQQKYDDARAVIEKGIEFERRLLKDTLEPNMHQNSAVIAMAIPDLAMARQDFASAERLYREKVEFLGQMEAPPGESELTRHQLHLATAQRELGRVQDALLTLQAAVESAERDFGAEHPRTEHARRRLAETHLLNERR